MSEHYVIPQSIYDALEKFQEDRVTKNPCSFSISAATLGLPVRPAADEACTKDQWVPTSDDPFVTLEESDEAWAKPLGFGSTKKTLVGYKINNPDINWSHYEPLPFRWEPISYSPRRMFMTSGIF